jgi:hypothetical protein
MARLQEVSLIDRDSQRERYRVCKVVAINNALWFPEAPQRIRRTVDDFVVARKYVQK